MEIIVHKAKKRGKTLEVRKDDSLQSGIFLHSRIDPLREAKNFIENVFNEQEASKYSAVIVLGVGLGYHLGELESRLSSNIPVLAVEKSKEIADLALKELKLSSRLLVSPTEEELEQAILKLPSANIKLISYRPSYELFPDYYDSIRTQIQTILSHKNLNIATLVKFEKIWIQNFFNNAPEIPQSLFAREILERFSSCPDIKKIPAVLVGAGPSLNEILPKLKPLQDTLFLVCVDTALRPLLKYGIRPDMVFTVDGQYVNSLYLLCNQAKVPLMAEPTAHPLSLRKWSGIKIFFSSPFSYSKWMEHFLGSFGAIQHGGSVSTNAFDFLRKAGFEDIILVGQDLAFSKEMAHTKGTYLDEMLYTKENRLKPRENSLLGQLRALPPIQEKSNSGNPIYTNQKLFYFKKWFDQEIPASEVRVFNTAGDGLSLAGSTYSSFEKLPPLKNSSDAIKKREIPCLNGLFVNLSDESRTLRQKQAEQWSNDTENFLQQLDSLLNRLKKATELSYKLMQIYRRRLDPRERDKQIQSVFRELEKLDVEIKSHRDANELLSPAMQRVIQNVLTGEKEFLYNNEEYRNKPDPLLENILTSVHLYEGMSDALKESRHSILKGRLLLKKSKI